MAPIIPPGRGNFVLGLEPMEILRILKAYGNPDIHTMINTRPIPLLDVIAGNLPYPSLKAILKAIRDLSTHAWTVEASAIALNMGNPLLTNMVIMGALIGTEIFPLTLADFMDIYKNIYE